MWIRARLIRAANNQVSELSSATVNHSQIEDKRSEATYPGLGPDPN